MSALDDGNAALRRAAFAEARSRFAEAVAADETPAALAGLGNAARAQSDGPAALDAHERGYRLARESGDARAAASLALELALDCLNFRGPAEAGGWLERASTLLDGLPPGFEHGVLLYFRAQAALTAQHDPAAAREIAAEGAALARRGGSVEGR